MREYWDGVQSAGYLCLDFYVTMKFPKEEEEGGGGKKNVLLLCSLKGVILFWNVTKDNVHIPPLKY